MTTNDMPAKNTDRELWRESDVRSQCTPSIHVTQDGRIGISVGGTVITRTVREWHELANHPRVPFIAPNGMTSLVAVEFAAIARGTPIIAKPEQPPFAPKQFVRIKSSGTILNVARCEKRVVHGALRWVVDDLNGMRAFAADCELVPTETPPVRYACTMIAKAGHTVKILAPSDGRLCRVLAVNGPRLLLRPLKGDGDLELLAEFVEFVPEVTIAHPVCRGCNQPLKTENAWMSDGCPCNNPRGINHGLVPKEVCTCEKCAESDHIVEADKMIEPAASDSILGVRHWQDAQRGVEVVNKSDYDAVAASRDEWERECDSQRKAIREGLAACQSMGERLAVAMSLLGQSGARMFMFGDYEARLKDGKWSLQKYVMGSWVYQGEFADPVQAALRAKELADLGKQPT